MITSRFLPASLLAVAALLASVLLSPPEAETGEPEFTMNFGTVAPDNTPWSAQLLDLKKRIEKESAGRIKVRVFLGGVMGGEVEMVRDIVEGGRLQGGGFSSGAVATGANVPAMQLPELPFLFRDNAEVDHILDTVLFEPLKKKMKRRGLFFAMWAENGWRSFFTKKKPIKTLDDLREHKMRVQEADVHKAMYKAFGVQAAPISTPEVMDALNRGTVDGFDNTTLFGQAAGWYEPMKYYTLSRHIYQPAVIAYSQDFYDALPEDLQTVLVGDRAAETKRGRDGVRELEDELIALFTDLGLEVYTPTAAELQPFIDASVPVQDQFKDIVGADLLEQVRAELAKMRQ